MKETQFLWKKILSAALVSTFAVVPILGYSSTATAAPRQDRFGYDHQDSDNTPDKKGNGRSDHRRGNRDQRDTQQSNQQNYDDNRNNDSRGNAARSDSRPAPDSDQRENTWRPRNNSSTDSRTDSNRSWDNHWRSGDDSRNDNRSRYDQSRENTWRPDRDSDRNDRFRENRDRDDNWYRSHGYVRNGSSWNWQGHDDDYWRNNGYSWNGSAWLRSGDFSFGVRYRDNNHRDDRWHYDHGYTRRNNRWYWRDHDDDYWLSNGYFWNGIIWAILANSHDRYGYQDHYGYYDAYGPYRTFEGIVTRVRYDDNEFDLRIDGKTFNVYPARGLPYRLDEGDIVRVYGQRYGNNDILSSDVDILRNR